MASLTAIFGSSTEKPEENQAESERLLKLYWNRAELKKEFAELRAEKFRLQDRVREHEGAAARVRQKLDHLEHLLLDPEWTYNIVTYYRLRGLNLRCQSKLAKFAEQLKQQREQRQHCQLLEEWNAARAAEAADIERQIGEQRVQVQMLEDHLQAERHRLATMSGFLKMIRGRSVTASLDNLAESIEIAQQDEQSMLLRLEEIEKRQPPDTQGLDVPTKRMINFMILAFGQQLYLHYRDADLAEMANEAAEKSLGAINYGDKESCDAILQRIDKRVESFDNAADSADILQQRAKLIAERARFRSNDDPVPVAASVSVLYDIDGTGTVSRSEVNLLGENYWNLTKIVSR